MEATFIVKGEPIGKIRHRSTVLPNGMIHNYNSKKNSDYERLVKLEYKRQLGNIYFTDELEVVINAYYPIPKSWSKKKRQMALYGEIRPVVKPDTSNVIKIIEDALNSVAYKDDSSIVSVHGNKYYSTEPRVEVTIIGDYVLNVSLRN